MNFAPPDTATAKAAPARTLGARHVVAVAMGVVVGAGIFRTPALVADAAGSEVTFLAAWVLGGLLSMAGALCYAELAAAYPGPGGDYQYLSRAFGRRLGFLYAWARLSVIQTGSLALLAFVVGDYAASLAGAGQAGSAAIAAAIVIGITGLNWLGVRHGAESQLWLTIVEVAGILLIGVAAFSVPAAPPGSAVAAIAGNDVGLVLVFVLLTYGGWSEAVYLSAELRGSRRRMAAVLIGSLAAVTILYVLVNVAYLRALGLAGVAGSEAVAADVMQRSFGAGGAVVISLIVAVAALTSANATAMTGARTTYALGRSFRGLGWLGVWNGARGTPGNALVAQGGIALLLVIAGAFARDGFRLAVEYTAPVFWFFLLLVGLALFVLRYREPDIERPFRVPLYPVVPALFCLTSAYLLYSSLAYTGASAVVGVAVLAAGAMLLVFLKPRNELEISP